MHGVKDVKYVKYATRVSINNSQGVDCVQSYQMDVSVTF